jgi:hypothetical protein
MARSALSSANAPQSLEADSEPVYVYAVGQVQMRFPSVSLEREFAQTIGRADTAGLSDQQAVHNVLQDRHNRYLARKLCWLFTIEGLETYLLVPRDPLDFELLIEAVRPMPRRTDVDVVIGVRGPLAPASMCNGLVLPVVMIDQLYSFDTDTLLAAIPRPDGVSAEEFQPRAAELYNRLVQLADNLGASDEHRALNYLATRYPDVYARTSQAFEDNYTLAQVEVHPSRLAGARKIVTVVFSYTPRGPGGGGFYSDQYFVRVDVTEEFLFLVTPLQRGFPRP